MQFVRLGSRRHAFMISPYRRWPLRFWMLTSVAYAPGRAPAQPLWV